MRTKPVVEGRWLRPGMHINAIGANFPQKRELDADAVLRADIIAADSREQSKIEAGDLIQAFAGDEKKWAQVHELAEIAAGRTPGRRNNDGDYALQIERNRDRGHCDRGRIYGIALEKKRGIKLPFWSKKKRGGSRSMQITLRGCCSFSRSAECKRLRVSSGSGTGSELQ